MTILECTDVSKTIGQDLVVDRASFALSASQTAVLSGAKGAGGVSPAETLLEMIAGDMPCHNGRIEIGPEIKTGAVWHLDQLVSGNGVFREARSAIPTDETMKEKLRTMELGMMYMKNRAYLDLQKEYDKLSREFEEDAPEKDDEMITAILDLFGMGEETYLQTVSELDEKYWMRLSLAKLLLAGVDLILIKKPEEYLTHEMCERAGEWVRQRGGAILAASDTPDLFGENTAVINM